MNNNVNENEATAAVTGLAKISKQVKESVVNIDKKQLRALVDSYYQAQDDREAKAAQLKAYKLKDTKSDKVKSAEDREMITAMDWLYKDAVNREAQIKEMLHEYCKNQPVCNWAMQIKGIGPVISSYLWAHLNLDECPTVGAFYSYAGLNDNNNPWLGTESARLIVKEAYGSLGYDKKHKADARVYAYISAETKRRIDIIKRGVATAKEASKKKKLSDYDALIKYLAKPPYNVALKEMCCFKIPRLGFLLNSRRGSLYGELYIERKALEEQNNNRLQYADQAAVVLERRKKYLKKEDIKTLESGKLLDSHLTTRALRRSVKIFLSHFWECAYRYENQINSGPSLYVMDILGHQDYIEPEVPFPNFAK